MTAAWRIVMVTFALGLLVPPIASMAQPAGKVKGAMTATTLEQLTSTGKHTPTAYMSGRCTLSGVRGRRFWLMVADNVPASGGTQTRDVVSVLVFSATGQRVAYGTGPLVQGDIDVQDTSQ